MRIMQALPSYCGFSFADDSDTSCISDNVAGMMYRPTSSGLLVPTSYQFGSNQIFQVNIAFVSLCRMYALCAHADTNSCVVMSLVTQNIILALEKSKKCTSESVI